MDSSKCLKILTLNVCGLLSKQNTPEFLETIKNYDIIGLQEIKMDDTDHFCIKDYTFYSNNRPAFTNRKSGGIGLLVKNSIASHVSILNIKSKQALWFTLSNKLTEIGDVLCGVLYVPPENSAYSVNDPYFEIKEEIDSVNDRYSHYLLFGDFNSRTKEKADFIAVNECILQSMNSEELIEEYNQEILSFENTNVNVNRKNCDQSMNNLGYKLTDFVQEQNLFILNGRTRGDLDGKVTSRNISTIDYFLCSSSLFRFIDCLSVRDFCPLLSDVHCPVSLCTSFRTKTTCTCAQTENTDIKTWNHFKKDEFDKNIKNDHINKILDEISRITHESIDYQKDIDSIVESIGSLFMETAEKSFGITTFKSPNHYCTLHKHNVTINPLPKWFKGDCKKARKKFHRAKLNYKLRKSEINKSNLKKCSKNYKHTLSKYSRIDREKIANEIKNTKHSNPRKFWKILNSESHQSDVKCSITDLHDYFKEINSSSQTGDNMPNLNINDENSENELNCEITYDEIEKALKNLKNNKACGIDKILNEHIKYSYMSLKHVYFKLFNLILDKGIFPKSWSSGIIHPVYKNKGDPTIPSNYRPITLLSCLGKLFTSILNTRLHKYVESNNIIHDYQSGFRKGFSTTDNMFLLHSLIQLAFKSKQKLFCAFIDLKQAFDTVWRDGLWHKLISVNINGKCLRLIKNMYNDIKSCVRVGKKCSNLFPCLNGLRQGENLSPILFSIYLNDLHDFFSNSGVCNGFSISN